MCMHQRIEDQCQIRHAAYSATDTTNECRPAYAAATTWVIVSISVFKNVWDDDCMKPTNHHYP